MTENLKSKSVISYIAMMIATVVVGSYAIGFIVRKSAVCDKDKIQFCTTQNVCVSNNLYWWDNYCHLNDQTKIESSAYPDYNSLSTLNNIILVENFDSYTPNSEMLGKYIKKGVILKNGKITKGYLEIVASINNKPLSAWESIYFKAPYNVKSDYLFGGHIFRPDSLEVPLSDRTHLLFALNNIPFLPKTPYSESQTPHTYDLFKIINDNKEIKFLTFISSLNPAKIDSIKIYYECDKNFNDGKCELTIK